MGEEGQEVTAVIQDRFADPGQPTRWNAAFHAQSVSISGGLFSSAGRDVNHHTHFHVAPKPEKPKFDLLSELKAIDNFRRIQQDTLSKATPKTGEWIFEYEIFPVWKDPKSKLKTMWGSGIPGAGKTVLTPSLVGLHRLHLHTLQRQRKRHDSSLLGSSSQADNRATPQLPQARRECLC
ncbi:hypothetical protein BKA70DRAFT_1315998 [Coprinopsis sp. MPI-PUGE-AT-0042]|nr:hypothetical protein BKA70DRAFT_1315998 [Coprinopsis sp. MPI-PUGE-AT-0042]